MMTHTEIHKEIKDNDVIELYVLNKLSADERRAFQEHFFACDQCFEEAQMAARFIAGVREASSTGVMAAEHTERLSSGTRWVPAVVNQRWAGAWLLPALAASLLLVISLTGLWVLSVRRENKQLADLKAEQSRASDRLQSLDAKIRELEASDSALQQQTNALRDENNRLKEQLTASERQREEQLAQLREPDINVPVSNIYPVGDPQRSSGGGQINRVRVPRGTRTFVLILGDYKPGYPIYRLEIVDPSERLVASREGLKPDQGGELSVMLNRSQIHQGKYRLKLYGGPQQIGEYVVQVE